MTHRRSFSERDVNQQPGAECRPPVGSARFAHKAKPTSGRLEIGAQIASFNFPNSPGVLD